MKQLIILLVFFLTFSCNSKKGESVIQKDVDNQLKEKPEIKSEIDINEIEIFLEEQAKKDSLHGTVLIADGDEILLRKAYGFKGFFLTCVYIRAVNFPLKLRLNDNHSQLEAHS